ncbi:unnamed protein product [Tenebrio molitor]|nr:unnamed protein product [Tenebrio molitor]
MRLLPIALILCIAFVCADAGRFTTNKWTFDPLSSPGHVWFRAGRRRRNNAMNPFMNLPEYSLLTYS